MYQSKARHQEEIQRNNKKQKYKTSPANKSSFFSSRLLVHDGLRAQSLLEVEEPVFAHPPWGAVLVVVEHLSRAACGGGGQGTKSQGSRKNAADKL